jgi:tyrosinase
MYFEPSEDVFSYYQLAGIHGLPHINWNQDTHGQGRNYCAHKSIIFGPWHRPYIAAFDQALQGHAIELAATYQVNKDDWQKAAIELRQPYWDWSLPDPMLPPEVIELDRVKIIQPDGLEVKVQNPFFGYNFQSAKDIETFIVDRRQKDFRTTPRTVRHPTFLGPNAETDLDALKEALKVSHTLNTRQLLLGVHDWQSFVTSAVDKSNKDAGFTSSLEALHGTIHQVIGGEDGHMGVSEVSSFDPIFWLHHCQVDRLMSLWHALNPGKWVPPPDNSTANEDSKTDLTPFWDNPATFWTSADVISHHVLNYNYKEFADFAEISGEDGDENKLKEYIKGIVEKLYPDPNPPTKNASEVTSWTVRIKCKEYEVGCSFSVIITFGAGILCGSGDFFVNGDPEECDNCREQAAAGLETQAFVHLDVPFVLIGLSEASDDTKVGYLKNNLHWRVEKLNHDHEIVKLPSLEIMVMKHTIDLRSRSLPTVSKPTFFSEITKGRNG